jgi:hypothetical protein
MLLTRQADIFTSMGVLLHLYSIDKAKLEQLEYEEEDEILKWGMEFLTAASTTSTLAARYATLLQGVRSKTSPKDPLGQSGTDAELRHTSVIAKAPVTPQPPETPQSSRLRQGVFGNGHTEIDLDGMNFDDLLFGAGIPQDIMSLNYPLHGFD